MNKQQFVDAYWTVRFAPYVFTIASAGFLVSLFWLHPRLDFMLTAFVSGSLLFVFHVLRWRTGNQMFQILAMAATFAPFFFIMFRHQPFVANMQYMATFLASHSILALLFRERLLRGFDHDA